MEKDHKSQPSNDKPADKKAPQQGGNLVWYMLGVGVLLLLMVTMLSSGNEQTLLWSDLLRLVEASGNGQNGSVDIVDRNGTQPQWWRVSDLEKVEVGNSKVLAEVTRQRLKPISEKARERVSRIEYRG